MTGATVKQDGLVDAPHVNGGALPRGKVGRKVGRIDSQSGVAYTFNGAEAMDLVSLSAGNRTITDLLRIGHEVSRMCNRVQL